MTWRERGKQKWEDRGGDAGGGVMGKGEEQTLKERRRRIQIDDGIYRALHGISEPGPT